VFNPVAQMLQRGGCAVSEVSKFVLHASGNLGVDGASEQAVVFRKVSRRVRQIPSGGLYEGLL
jgi:hypothetical protein